MATNEDFTLKNGIIVSGDFDSLGNIILTNTSSIIIGNNTINGNTSFSSNAIWYNYTPADDTLSGIGQMTNSSFFESGTPINIIQIYFPNTAGLVPTNSHSSQFYSVMVEWGLVISWPAITGGRSITSLLSGGRFGGYTQSKTYIVSSLTGTQTNNYISGFGIMGPYAATARPEVVLNVILNTNFSGNLGIMCGDSRSFVNLYIMTSANT